ncbi:hypothetical protein D3C79_866250 [compost metagenome]
MAALFGDHCPAAQSAGCVQRAAGVQLPAVVVPTAAGQGDVGMRSCQAALAHEIHPAGSAAGAFHHARCAAQHFDPVVVRHVAAETVGLDIEVAHVQRHTVVLILARHAEPA